MGKQGFVNKTDSTSTSIGLEEKKKKKKKISNLLEEEEEKEDMKKLDAGASRKTKKGLFDDDDDEDDHHHDSHGEEFNINQGFAMEYAKKKSKEEASKFKHVSLEDDDDSEEDSEDLEEEDDIGEELDEETDLNIHRTIQMIRNKDSRIYDPSFHAFKEKEEGINDDDDKSKSKKMDKPLTYKKLMTEKLLRGEINDDDDDDDDDEKDNGKNKLSYQEELLEAKRKLKEALKEEEDDDDELIVEKPDSKLSIKSKKSSNNLNSLFTEPAKDDNEKFLRWYVLEKPWKQQLEEIPEPALDEDLDEVEKAEEFETKYNFRFEEEGGAQIVSHARDISSSTLRRQDDSRKRLREQKRKAKEEEKERKLQEIRRLKNLKRQALEEKIKSLSKVAGASLDKNGKGFTPEDLDDDFDPEKWDKKMSNVFGEDYYEQEEDDVESLLGRISEDEYAAENDEELAVTTTTTTTTNDAENKRKRKRSKKNKSRKHEDEDESEEVKRLRKQLEEELDELDFEGTAGGQTTRFKYRKVTPNSFGLTTEEILEAPPAVLNQLVSLKQMAPYREDEFVVSTRRRQRIRKMLRGELSLEENEKNAASRKKSLNNDQDNDDDNKVAKERKKFSSKISSNEKKKNTKTLNDKERRLKSYAIP